MDAVDVITMAHVLSVVLWIGGEAFVTLVIFPTIQGIEDPIAQMKTFLGVERRFSMLAKVGVGVAGLTGIWLFYRRGGFAAFTGLNGLMHGYKLFVWLCFFAILFGGEKRLMGFLVSHQTAPAKALRRVTLFHWVLMIMAGIAIGFGVLLS